MRSITTESAVKERTLNAWELGTHVAQWPPADFMCMTGGRFEFAVAGVLPVGPACVAACGEDAPGNARSPSSPAPRLLRFRSAMCDFPFSMPVESLPLEHTQPAKAFSRSFSQWRSIRKRSVVFVRRSRDRAECLAYAPAAIASARRGNLGLKPRSSRMRRPSRSTSNARPRSAFEPSGGGDPTDASSVARSGASSSTTL